MHELQILSALRQIHSLHRLKDGDVSAHTKSAQRITKEWQAAVGSDQVGTEVPVSPKNSEKIDVVCFLNRTAYELKVSGKNTHHEFFKDIFKVITYNEYNSAKLHRLVFVSEQQGIRAIERRLDPRLVSRITDAHELALELVSI